MGRLSKTFPTAESVDAALKRANRAEVNVASLYGELLNKVDNADFNEETQNLQNQINNIISPVTQDAEVQNARVGHDSTSYSTLKNRLDSEYNILSESISATNEDVDEKIANITEVIGKTISSFTVGTSQHSSRSDMIPWSGKAGDTIYISVSSSPTLSPQRNGGVYTYLNDIGTEYGSILIDSTTPKAVTLLNDVDYIGIWIPALDEECEITVVVEGKNSIIKSIDEVSDGLSSCETAIETLTSNMSDLLGKTVSSFVVGTSQHSSRDDMIPWDGKTGDKFHVVVTADPALSSQTNGGIYSYNNVLSTNYGAILIDGEGKYITLTDDCDHFGIWIPELTEEHLITVTIESESSTYFKTKELSSDLGTFKNNVNYYSVRYPLSSSHSSTVDRINIDGLKEGSIITIYADNDGGAEYNVAIFAKKGTNEGVKICEVPFGSSKTIRLNDEYDSFGAYSATPDKTGYATIAIEVHELELVYNQIDKIAYVKNGTIWQGQEASSTTRCISDYIDIDLISNVVASDDFKFYVAYFDENNEMVLDSGWYSETKTYDIDNTIDAVTVRIGMAYKDDRVISVSDAVSNILIRTTAYDILNYKLNNHVNTFDQIFRVLTKNDIIRGSWNASGQRVSSATRLTSKEKIPCLYGSYIEYDAKDLYMAIDVWNDDGTAIISSSGWSSGRNRFYLKGSYFTVYVANGADWGTSTDIFMDDYDCDIFYFKSAPYENPPEKNLGDPTRYAIGFSNLLKDCGSSDAFLFFTDPHIVFHAGWEERLSDCLNYVKTIQDVTPISFVLNGGDWLGNSNTQAEAAYMLSMISARMHKYFGDDYVMLVGNHDTNYQGVVSEDDDRNGIFSHAVMNNLYNTKYRKSYFVYKAPTFDMYCFDSWTGKNQIITNYGKEQVKWFANALTTNQTEKIVIAIHIIEDNIDYGVKIIDALANELSLVAKAFNSRSTYTIDGETYNFSSAIGKVAFMIGGHYHDDEINVVNTIPYALTTNAGDGGTYTGFPLDLCAVDWDNGKLHLYRCDRTEEEATIRTVNIII